MENEKILTLQNKGFVDSENQRFSGTSTSKKIEVFESSSLHKKMKISKTKINKRMQRKTNPKLVATIQLAKKNNFLDLAKNLSKPTRQQSKISLDNLNKIKEDKVLVIGKVLGQGKIEKKISIAALGFSKQAKEKLKKSGSEIKTFKQMIEENEKLKGVKIV